MKNIAEDKLISFRSINQWKEDDRPREKLMSKGRQSLSDSELLAILINTGTRTRSALDLSRELLLTTSGNLTALGKQTLGDYQKIKGIGQAKAVTIAAAIELGRRRNIEPERNLKAIRSSKDAFNQFVSQVQDLQHEEFWVLLLNRANIPLGIRKVSSGGMTGTVVDAKVLFKIALDLAATNVILCHNHPSGNLQPSKADEHLTNKLKEAGVVLDIPVLDHLIIGGSKYFSFADEGYL